MCVKIANTTTPALAAAGFAPQKTRITTALASVKPSAPGVKGHGDGRPRKVQGKCLGTCTVGRV